MKYHYVYRITNRMKGKHYYGVRSSEVEPKCDLGVVYFSSSKDKEFINEQITNKENFKYKVVKTFNTREDAMNYEIQLHDMFNVGVNPYFYNMCKQTSIGFSNISQESILKIKNTLKTLGEDGLTITERAQINRLDTTNNGNAIYKDSMTYNEYYGYSAAQSRKGYQDLINEKISQTKQKRTIEDKEIAKLKFNETMSKLQENGLTKMQNKGNAHSNTMKTKSTKDKEITKLKFNETMSKIGADGLTGWQRRALTRKMNKTQKEINENNS